MSDDEEVIRRPVLERPFLESRRCLGCGEGYAEGYAARREKQRYCSKRCRAAAKQREAAQQPNLLEQLLIEWIDELRQQNGGGPMPEEYDRRTCVTAAEVRAQGIPLPRKIPDVAWIPRAALEHSIGEMSSAEDGEVRCQLIITFTRPFRWLEGTVEQTGDGNAPITEEQAD